MTHRIRRLASTLVAAAVLAAPLFLAVPAPSPVTAGAFDPNDPRFAELRQTLMDFGFGSDSINTVAGAVREYPEPNYFHPSGQMPGIRPSSIHMPKPDPASRRRSSGAWISRVADSSSRA